MKHSEKTLLRAVPSTALSEHAAILRANSETYERLVGKLRMMARRKTAETVLCSVETAATFAANFHPGRFADGAIENLALEIGAELGDSTLEDSGFTLPRPVARKDGRRRVLHVTLTLALGGHTPLMEYWIRNDRSSCHSVLLVNQQEDVPSQWSEVIRSRGGNLVVLPPESNLEKKARWLREVARQSADLVLLHLIWPDVVPTVAFATRECPTVAVVDHCDHMFLLGSSVTDMLINLRTVGSEHTAERRFAPCNSVVPIPLLDPWGKISRRDARLALGIGEHQIMLLSVGRPIKYWPCGSYDFVATANKILDCQPGAHLYVVGESAAGIAPYLRCAVHERLHFVGRVEDPSQYRAAADIYLESFPYGSQTALLEAALSRLPVVPAYAPLSPLQVANDDAVRDILFNPHDEQEYVERVELLIRQPEQRAEMGETLRERLLVNHVGEGWLARLDAAYRETDRLTHHPRPIPASPCSMTDADIGLSLWHTVVDGKTVSAAPSGDGVEAVLCHAAFTAKYAGDYETARRYAWSAVRHNPYRRTSWRLLAVTLLGRVGRFMGRMMRRA